MPQTVILVDSSSYFRLAQNINPLLGVIFGSDPEFVLYAHEKLVEEFTRERRLQTKFDWFSSKEYVENRGKIFSISRTVRKGIASTFDYMWEHVQAEELGPSRVDVGILATAAELSLRIVTDDQDLLEMAGMYGVYAMTTLELLRLMVDEGHITIEKVQQVVAQWQYDRDTPANFSREYKKRFGAIPPAE